MTFKGIGASSGIAIGKVFIYRPFEPVIPESMLEDSNIPEAISRLDNARTSSLTELRSIIARMTASRHDAESAIFEAHLELADDEDIWEEIKETVQEGINPFQAVDTVFNTYIDIMASNDDELMKERAADLKDIKKRILRNLSGQPESDLSTLDEAVIIAARDLLPTDTATMDRDKVLGILTESGGITSHSAIIARSYAIPAVLGMKDVLRSLEEGSTVILDGEEGLLITAPDENMIRNYDAKQKKYRAHKEIVEKFRSVPCATADGIPVSIGVNLGNSDDEALKSAVFADFNGLFRTEFLYMQSKELPSEEKQFDAYKKLLQAFREKPVVLRTLDIGGDKELECMDLPKEENPFLGKRALRLCFDNDKLFLTQLRAALRASVFGNLWIMFPMVGTMEDWDRAMNYVKRAKEELDKDNIPYSHDIKYGIMIEIPAIALMAEEAAREVDFASIGTNDLCQYTLAVDRGNPELTSYYQMYSPAVFRLISGIAAAFAKAGKPLSVCGEMGGDKAAALVLAGLGIRKLSMSESSIADIKYVLSTKTSDELQEIARQALSFRTAGETESYLRDLL